jgi:post-segregation antitoxin (ccd killing protein)
MPYKIISPRLGEPGTEYDAENAAANGINVSALIEAGFLEESTNETAKPAKTNSKNSAKD